MALRDLLAAETADAERAAGAAASGQSITGLSGRVTERRAEAGPIYGERVVDPLRVSRMLPRTGEGPGDALPPGRSFGDGRQRVPFGAREQQLAFPDRPGYRRYWFNDVPGRVQRAIQAGYEHVRDPHTGEPIGIVTDRTLTGGRKSYLMETPIEFYMEDMGRAAADLDDRLREIKQGQAGPGASDGRYIPQQGISVQGR